MPPMTLLAAGMLGAAPTRLKYNDGVRSLLPWAEQRLLGYMDAAGVPTCRITSTKRTVEDQARIMFQNLESPSVGVDKQRALYGRGGNRVIDVYVAGKTAGLVEQTIRWQMAEAIRQVGPRNVSKHIEDPDSDHEVADIAPSSMTTAQGAALLETLKQARSKGEIGELIWPPRDPAFHVEFVPGGGATQILQAATNVVDTSDDSGGQEGESTDKKAVGVFGAGALVVTGLVGLALFLARKR